MTCPRRSPPPGTRGLGVDGIMVHQPVHPYVSPDGWVDYHRAIAEAVPEFGVVLYIRNPRIGGEHLAALRQACDNLVGIKYAVPDPALFACVARDSGLDEFTWVAGLAELSAPGYFAVGATGFTTGLANVSPELSLRMHAALSTADYPHAMRIWELVRPFEQLRAADDSANNVSVVKEALAQPGLCRRDIRPPSRVLRVDLRRGAGRGTGAQPQRDPAPGPSTRDTGRGRGAARQPGPRWRCDQVRGRDAGAVAAHRGLSDGRAVAAVRPEDFSVVSDRAENTVAAEVEIVEYHGREQVVEAVLSGGQRLHVRTVSRLAPGDSVHLTVPPERVLVFAPEGEAM